MDGLYDELRATLHAIWIRRWIALAVAWGVCLAGWLAVSQIPNQYQSKARVFVQLRTILPTDAGFNQAEQQKDIDRIRSTLTSAVNLEKVVRGTDLANTVSTDRDIADRVAGLQNVIKVTAQQDNLFEISATLANPSMSDKANAKLAKAIVQKMIDIFVEDNLADNRDETQQSLAFLDQSIAARKRQIQDLEAKRADFTTKYLGSLPGTGSLDERVQAARAQLAQVDSDLSAAQSELSAINGQLAGTAATAGGNTVSAGPLRARVATIEAQIAEGRGRGWTDSHPDMIALKGQLAAAKAAARNEPVGGPSSSNPIYFGLKTSQTEKAARVAALSQRKAQIEGDLQTLQSRLDADPGAAAEQSTIDRDYQAAKDAYDKLLADREQVRLKAQVQDTTDSIKFSVIDPPTAPRAPTAPNRPLLLTGVLILGLGAGIAVAFGLAKLQTRFSTAAQLERSSGMTVIGSIGEVLTDAQVAIKRRRLRLFAGGLGALAGAWLLLIGLELVQRGMVA